MSLPMPVPTSIYRCRFKTRTHIPIPIPTSIYCVCIYRCSTNSLPPRQLLRETWLNSSKFSLQDKKGAIIIISSSSSTTTTTTTTIIIIRSTTIIMVITSIIMIIIIISSSSSRSSRSSRSSSSSSSRPHSGYTRFASRRFPMRVLFRGLVRTGAVTLLLAGSVWNLVAFCGIFLCLGRNSEI